MHRARGLVRYYAHDYGAAEAAQRKALELNPQLPLARVVLAKSLVLGGKPQEALEVLQQSPQADAPDVRLMTAIAHARMGNTAAAERIVGSFATAPARADILLQWHAATGNHAAAFSLLQSPQRKNVPIPPVLRFDPLYERFRTDSRFAAYP
jgi:predicted Zn-dependent protease